MKLLELVRSQQKTRKMGLRFDPKQLNAPYDKGVRKITRHPKFTGGYGIFAVYRAESSNGKMSILCSFEQTLDWGISKLLFKAR